jgi:uncharacterized protein
MLDAKFFISRYQSRSEDHMLDNLLKKRAVVEKTDEVVRMATEGQAAEDSAGALVGKPHDKILLLNKQNTTFQKTLNASFWMNAITPTRLTVPTASTAHSRGFSSLGVGRADILLVDNPATIELEPEPIPRDWILAGAPAASVKMLSRSRDWTSSIIVWDCTPGRFSYHYNKDEILFVISGQATITNKEGQTLDFEPGAVVYIPAGASCIWDIKNRIRKVAVMRESLWRPHGICVKVWAKLLRVAGVGGKSPL